MDLDRRRHSADRRLQWAGTLARRAGIGIAFAALLVDGACSQTPSTLFMTITADDGTPPIADMRTTITSLTNPGLVSSNQRRSLAVGDASDRPLPFQFPLYIPLTLDTAFAGAVTLTVEGLDWDTQSVIARGTTTATVVASQQTDAALTLTATPPATGAGGAAGATGAGGMAGSDGAGGALGLAGAAGTGG